MILKVNGESQEIDSPRPTIAELLSRNRVQSPEMVSVQRNGEFVERADYDSVVLESNDEVDFLYFMGGGA